MERRDSVRSLYLHRWRHLADHYPKVAGSPRREWLNPGVRRAIRLRHREFGIRCETIPVEGGLPIAENGQDTLRVSVDRPSGEECGIRSIATVSVVLRGLPTPDTD